VIGAGAVLPLALGGVAEAARPPSGLAFARRTWAVRSGTGGPGPNTWAGQLPYVDADGLHLRVAQVGGRWSCSEVFLTSPLGFGTYEWSFRVPAGGLDANVVLGLFTYETDTRETDVELARWGDVDGHNAQWAVQPATPDNLLRFDVAAGATVVARYRWSARGTADFSGSQSLGGATTPLPSWSNPRATTSKRGKAHMNLWLFQGRPPVDGAPAEVVVTDFRFAAG